jgi:hypothetical protein
VSLQRRCVIAACSHGAVRRLFVCIHKTGHRPVATGSAHTSGSPLCAGARRFWGTALYADLHATRFDVVSSPRRWCQRSKWSLPIFRSLSCHTLNSELHRDALAFYFTCWSNSQFACPVSPDRKRYEQKIESNEDRHVSLTADAEAVAM